MEKDTFGPAWEKHKAALRQQHPHLTDEDLAYEAGKEEELLERLQAKLGKTKKEIRSWLSFMG
jgi:uncharacterized protein YjbJ (UPF0337 family)